MPPPPACAAPKEGGPTGGVRMGGAGYRRAGRATLAHPAEAPERRVPNRAYYALWCASHAVCATAMARWHPATVLCHIVIAYFTAQALFVTTHLIFHALFATSFDIFVRRPETVPYGVWVAWYHHYCDKTRFTQNWLEYRLANVALPGDGGRWLNPALWFVALMPLCTVAVTRQLAMHGAGGCTDAVSVAAVDVLLVFSWHHVQALTHEWYHVPAHLQPGYFTLPPVAWLFFALEWSGLINSARHRKHHQHDHDSLTEADEFWDMWVPAFADRGVTAFWRWAVRSTGTVEEFGAAFPAPASGDTAAPGFRAGPRAPLLAVVDRYCFGAFGVLIAASFAAMHSFNWN